jgi:hypothetical protein
VPTCARPLVARVADDDEELLLMSMTEGAHAAASEAAANDPPKPRGVLASAIIGAFVVLAVHVRYPGVISTGLLPVFEIAGAAAGVAVSYGVRLLRAQRASRRLVHLLPQVERGLEADSRGYRE